VQAGRQETSSANFGHNVAYKVVVQPQAQEDVAAAYAYIAERAPEAGLRWLVGIEQAIKSLCEMPSQFPLAPEAEKLQFPIHQGHYGKRSGVYRLIFRIVEEAKEVHVLAVRHGARKPIEMEDV
jgi:plasmid stabilization system protein ParE